jgi:hypothetical protein
MTPKRKRPISVWIAQIILGIYGFGMASVVLWGLYKGLTEGIPNPELFLVTTVGVLTFAAVFVGGVWGMAVRKPWGRWLGVAGLAILLIGGTITQTSRFISNSGSRFASISFLFAVLVVLGLAILTYLVALGDASEDFFNGDAAKVPEPERED